MQVRDSVSRKPIENVLILDTRGVFLAETHIHGKAWFEYSLPEVMVDVKMHGYKNKKAFLSSTQGSSSLILLTPDTTTTPEAIVQAARSVQNLSQTHLRKTTVRRSSELESLVPAATTVQDLVSTISAAQPIDDPVLGSSVGLNGLGGQNVKLLIDGQPVAGRMSGNVDMSSFSLSDIQAVQVYFGPQSIIYGSDASGGLINLISFEHEKKTQAFIQSYLESIGRYNIDGHFNFKLKDNHVGIKLGRYYFDGFSVYDSLKRQKTWLPKEQYFAGLQWRKKWLLKKGTFLAQFRNDYYIEYLYNPGEPQISNTQQTATAFDYKYTTHRDNGALTLSYWGAKWKHNLQTSFSSFNRRSRTYFLDFVQESKEEIQNGNTPYDEYSLLQSRYIAQNRSDKLGVQLGTEINLESGDGDKFVQTQKRTEAALFGMLDYRIANWHILPGIRWSYFSTSPSKFIPALQVTNELSDKWYLEFGYTYAYRVPTLKEMHLSFVDANHNIKGNPDLQAESTHSMSAGLRYSLEKLWYKLGLKWTSTYYDTDDKIVLASQLTAPNAYTYQNIESIQNLSHNLDINFAPLIEGQSLELISSTNWLYFLKYGDAQNLHSFNQSFRAKWGYSKWQLGITLNSKTSLSQRVFVIDTDEIVDRELENYTLFSTGVYKKLWKNKLVVELGVKNALNVQQIKFKDGKNAVGVGGAAHGSSGASVLSSPGRTLYMRLGLDI